MNLEKVEQKFKANYKFSNARESGSGGFILSDGSVIVTTNHAACCEKMGMKLANVLEIGICRYASHLAFSGNVIAFEYSVLTMKQKNTIRKILKTDDFYTVVTTKTTTNRNCPIRSIQF